MSKLIHQRLRDLIEGWREEYNDLKEGLILKGGEPNTTEYSLLATEALRLSCCISDATDLLVTIVATDREDKA